VRRRLLIVLATALAPCLARAETAIHPVVDLETGAVWMTRNDVRVPGGSGTRFTVASGGDFQPQTAPYVRAKAGATLGRHALFATFAPLRLHADGSSQSPIRFRNLDFTATGDASVVYQLDTYRLTYRYSLVASPSLDLAVGATALLRDTAIRLSQLGQSSSERETSFLPLFSFRAAWRLGGGPFALSIDGDALPARTKRLDDVAVALEFDTGNLAFRAGYRFLEGGTDDSSVYNFAWLNHALAGVSYRFY
jgi:hypothetical protein